MKSLSNYEAMFRIIAYQRQNYKFHRDGSLVFTLKLNISKRIGLDGLMSSLLSGILSNAQIRISRIHLISLMLSRLLPLLVAPPWGQPIDSYH